MELLPFGRRRSQLVPFLRRLAAAASTVAPRLPWLLRLRNRSGEVVGAGFLIEGGNVLTCAHLVRDALEPADGVAGPDDVVEFDLGPPGRTRVLRARVIPGGWFPYGPQRDIAVLKLLDQPPVDVVPAILHAPSELVGHRYRVHGFAPGADHAVTATGELTDPGAPGLEWLQLSSMSFDHQGARPVFRGSPVWDETAGGVVGLVVAEDHYTDTSVAWMLPTRSIQESWPPLRVRRQPTLAGREEAAERVTPRRAATAGQGASKLPRPVPEFVGRQDELEEILRLAEADPGGQEAHARTVLIFGKPGIGKSTLAIKAAEQLQLSSRLPDGQLYADLLPPQHQPPIEPADVLAEFLLALGVDGAAIPPGLEARAALYQARLSRRRLLIVLDNAEDMKQVQVLRPFSPGCFLLVTTREAHPELNGAHQLELGPFDSKEGIALLSELAGRERVESERAAAKAIVELCGYLPLAVRVAGGRLAAAHDRSLHEFLRELRGSRQRLSNLAAGPEEVRRSLVMSYEGRTEQERKVFRLLSLLKARSFPAWVAAALLDGNTADAAELMDGLLTGHLLEDDGDDEAEQQRYRFHGLLRDLASELIDEEPPEVRRAALERVVSTYVSLAKAAGTLWEPLERREISRQDLGAWLGMRDASVIEAISQKPLAWLAAERASVVAMAESAHEAGLWALTWQLAEAMVDFLQFGAHWDDWGQLNKLSLEAAQRAGDRRAEARTLRRVGDLHREQRQWQEAIDCYQESLRLLHGPEEPREEAATRHRLGLAQRDRGKWDEAVASIRRCLPTFSVADRRAWAIANHDLGVAERNRGLWDLAIGYIARSLAVFQQAGDRRGQAHARRGIGVAYRNHGWWDDAIENLDEAVALFSGLDERWGLARTLANRGDVYQERGDYGAATRDLMECLRLHQERGDRRLVADTQRRFSVLLRKQGAFDRALACLHACLPELRVPGEERWEHYALLNLAEVYVDLGEDDKARELLRTCLTVFRDQKDRLWEAKALTQLGVVLSRATLSEERREGERCLLAALAIFEELDSANLAEVRELLAAAL
jgi:tetratricopeptide (TPR) repeat protein